jgi:opacity protein-like surface antigen
MLNGRLGVPLGALELYGGLGLGTIYYDGKVGPVSASGWAFAWDGFLGADLLLKGKWTLGLEGKYYATDDVSDLGGSLDMYALMLTLGTRR